MKNAQFRGNNPEKSDRTAAMEPSITQASAGAPTGDAGLIKDTTTETFAADVIQASQEVPVIVDFWAPWCGPCKTLGPMIEKIVLEARGAVRLVKMNIDDHPAIAQQLRVQSIPAVFAFKGGQPVDGFVGAVPESQIREFITKLTGDLGPSPIDQALSVALQAFEDGDLSTAAQTYAGVLQEDQGRPEAIAGLAKCYLANGDIERAQQTLQLTPPDARNHPDILSADAAVSIAERSADTGETDELNAQLEKNPNDHQIRFDLALALNARGDKEAAVEALLEIVARQRNWNDEAARKQLVELFDAYGPKDDVTLSGRRRLSSLLFA